MSSAPSSRKTSPAPDRSPAHLPIGTTNWMYSIFFSSHRRILTPSLVHSFQHDRALGFLIKCKNGVSAEFLHRPTKLPAGLRRHHVTMKRLPAERPRDRPIRADQPQIESQLFRNGQGKRMPPPSHQNNLNPCSVRPPQAPSVALRHLKLWIQQRPVDIGRQQPDGRLKSSLPSLALLAWGQPSLCRNPLWT